ncbi:hypothetical protein HMPREF2738_01606 [Clostridiales bacterium KLE1615]|nr:hypothetical protein HMPREF2738_01606 [Clostridiales bacterium KLE1615]
MKMIMAVANLYTLCFAVTISITIFGKMVVKIGINVPISIFKEHQHKSGE